MEHFDLIVIGSGPGGYVAAIHAAKLGLKTACVEKNKKVGGTCLNIGCIPSKALLHSSHLFSLAKRDFCPTLEPDFLKMQEHKEQVVESLVQGIEGLFKQSKVQLIQGEAHFATPTTIEVDKTNYSATNFIIATGSDSIALDNLPFDEKKILSSTGILSLKKIPKTMTVVGAGVIGVELASVYQALGTKVTVVEMLDGVCMAMDKEVSRELERLLKKQGIIFHLKTKYEQNKFPADVTLVAIGRAPFTKGLGLEKIGIEVDAKGFVSINQNYQTVQPHIYAIGDVVPGIMLAHRASDEGLAVVEMIAGKSVKVNLLAIPNVIYTHPEAASVGMTEIEAKKAGLETVTGKCFMKAIGRARATDETEGFVKVIGDKKSGKLIGLHLLSAHASELIGEGVIAIQKGMTVRELAFTSHAHPTLSEAIKEAALTAISK